MTKYTCPMHPQIIKDEPGKCPLCGMKLIPLGKIENMQHSHNSNVMTAAKGSEYSKKKHNQHGNIYPALMGKIHHYCSKSCEPDWR